MLVGLCFVTGAPTNIKLLSRATFFVRKLLIGFLALKIRTSLFFFFTWLICRYRRKLILLIIVGYKTFDSHRLKKNALFFN